MLFAKLKTRPMIPLFRGAFRPRVQGLEARVLLAVDLGGVAAPALPNVATAPFGVELGGAQSSGGAGFSTVDVGDVNGDGFDDFLIGGPTVLNQGGTLTIGAGNNSRVYLVFGSKQSQDGNVNWLTLAAQNRVGDLGQLGNPAITQTNPINGQATFPFDGVTFFTSQTPGSQLGASVSVVSGLNGGTNAILIGAPGSTDATGANPGTGRAYLIYGGATLNSLTNKTVDLDNPTGTPGINVVTFVNSALGSQTGRAVAGVGDVITDGIPDFAIGAPVATVGGQIATGAVYLLSGQAFRNAQTTTVNLATVGQAGGTPGVIFTGAATNDRAGSSLAPAGNFNGALTSANQPIGDFLIGAPNANGGTGAAYLIYGATNLTSLATLTNGVNLISLSNIGTPSTTNTAILPGIVFTGTALGDLTGDTVAFAGDFNNDGFGDILIGSPGYLGSTGRADMIYGQAGTTTGPLTGTIPLNNIPTTVSSATFIGATAGDEAGFALTAIGPITGTGLSEIAIGAPGFNAGQGSVYVIPGNLGLIGTFNLSTAASQPVAATQITITATTGTPAFLGASLSGRLPAGNQTFTADSDSLGDLIIGAPGLSIANGRGLDGGAFIIEGAFLPLQTPISTAITTQIGVNTPFPPFSINATAPAALNIFVFSNATITPPFRPVTDINPATVVVNGVAFPNATITADPVDENKDGIPDAIITITPRSALNLPSGTVTFVVTGRTLAGSPNANRIWSGTAQVTVTGGGGGGGGGVSSTVPVGFIQPTVATYPFGPETFVPSVAQLSLLDYQPIPLGVAVHQFLPAPGFGLRERKYFHPNLNIHESSKLPNGEHGIWTLSHQVFTRSKFKPGKALTFTHKVRVVPNYRQTERLGSTLAVQRMTKR